MKHRRWAALGLALFGFSLLGSPTTAVAASKLSSLRAEVSQLTTQRDSLTAAIADLEASVSSKTEAKATATATLAEGEGAHKELAAKNAEIEEANGLLLDQIEESQGKEASLRKDLSQVKAESKERQDKLKSDFAGTKLGEAGSLEEVLAASVEILTGEDSTVVELERKRTATAVLIAAEEAIQSKLQEQLDADDGQIAKQFKESEARRKELESKVAQLDKEIAAAKSEAEAKRKELENTKSSLSAKEAELAVLIENLHKEAIGDATTSFNGEEDQALLAKTDEMATDPGLSAHAARMKNFLGTKFGVTAFSTYRAGDDDRTGHGHSSGLAVDFMVDSAKGDELAAYLKANYAELGVYYVIWEQRYLMDQGSIYGPAWTWNLMPDRGSATANHYDHVHVSFKR